MEIEVSTTVINALKENQKTLKRIGNEAKL